MGIGLREAHLININLGKLADLAFDSNNWVLKASQPGCIHGRHPVARGRNA
jgi:hypothetical protein